LGFVFAMVVVAVLVFVAAMTFGRVGEAFELFCSATPLCFADAGRITAMETAVLAFGPMAGVAFVAALDGVTLFPVLFLAAVTFSFAGLSIMTFDFTRIDEMSLSGRTGFSSWQRARS